MSFFGGNPFATPVGQKIELATACALPSEDWGLNLEICDLINDTEEGPRDAVKAIRKRLTAQPKNYTVVMYTLTVLETCVKNCGKRFHVLVCTKDFVQELVKLIGPKNDPPAAVQEKVLSLIQAWADAFRHQPELSGVSQMYADLKHKGVEFPMTNLDTMAPILTPQRTVASPEPRPPRPPQQPTQQQQQQQQGGGLATSPRRLPPVPQGPLTLTPDQTAKLQSELDIVEQNMKVLSEMLTELTPGKEHPSDLELLQELHVTCRAMQQRVMELVGHVSNDAITANLLQINDNLNNLFIRYDRYMNKVKAVGSPSNSPLNHNNSGTEEVSLIDLNDEAPSAKLEGLSIGSATKTKKNDDADFDMFAQSRTATYETSKNSGSTYKDNSNVDQLNTSLGSTAQMRHQPRQQESDFDEMERWLNEQQPNSQGGSNAGGGAEETITSSEFDKFLAERAAAADSLPTISAATGSSGTTARQRTFNKEEKENQMFAL